MYFIYFQLFKSCLFLQVLTFSHRVLPGVSKNIKEYDLILLRIELLANNKY